MSFPRAKDNAFNNLKYFVLNLFKFYATESVFLKKVSKYHKVNEGKHVYRFKATRDLLLLWLVHDTNNESRGNSLGHKQAQPITMHSQESSTSR